MSKGYYCLCDNSWKLLRLLRDRVSSLLCDWKFSRDVETRGGKRRGRMGLPKTIGVLHGTTWCDENRSNVCVLGDVNPVCYRHRLPAISGSLFKVLVAGLGGAFSGIWPASSWHKRLDDDDNDVGIILRISRAIMIVGGATGERGCWRASDGSWCYRFEPALGFLDSCQSPGSVSFRQPIRGVIAARSPSLMPRFRHTRSESAPLPAEPLRSGRGCGCGCGCGANARSR